MIRAIIVLLLAACSTSKTAESTAHLETQQAIDGQLVEHREIESAQQEARWTVQQPAEIVQEDFAPVPDGGVVLKRRIIKRLGVKETTTGINRDYVARSDGQQGLEVRTSAVGDAHATSTATMKPAGGCMLGLGFWGAVAIAALLAVGVGILKLKARAAAKAAEAAKALLP